MKLTDLIKRSARNLKSAKMRTILTSLAIAIGGFTLSLTLAASNGARSYVDKILTDNFDPKEVYVYNDKAIFNEDDTKLPKEYSDNSEIGVYSGRAGNLTSVKLVNDGDIEKINKLNQVEYIVPSISVNPEYISYNDKKYIGTLQQLGTRYKFIMLTGKDSVEPGKREVIIPEPFVKAFGFNSVEESIDKTIKIAVKNSSTNSVEGVDFKIVGVKKNTADQQPGTEFSIYLDWHDMQSLQDLATQNTSLYRSYNLLVVGVKDGESQSNIEKAQAEIGSLGYYSKSSKDLQSTINQLISTLQIIVLIFGFITLVASIFGIINTMYISVLERIREIGLMKALGMSSRSVLSLFTIEAIWIGFLGGVIGNILALIAAKFANPVISKQLDLEAGFKFLEFNVQQVALLILALMLIGMLSGLLPARKASKLNPIEALRTE